MTYSYPFKNADEDVKRAVWSKGHKIVQNGKTYDPDILRWDICGNVMRYSDHGNTNSDNGWEVDHIMPSSKGGPTRPENLQPLYWENNRRKGDTYPWNC